VDFEQGISSAVMRLRDALRDSVDNPVFIETIERRGYRWIGPIQRMDPVPQQAKAESTKEESSQRHSLEKQVITAGPFPWRKMVFIFPVLAMLFSVWIFRPGRHDGNVSAKTSLNTSPHHQPANREAEDYYLKGRFYWNKRTPESLNLAVDSFTQAIVHDPNYSDAYVGLADCYNLMREYTAMPASEAYPRAMAAAKKAVELDDRSAQAHAALAFVSFFGRWDSGTADEEFRRAIELDPSNANARHWHATFLNTMRRFDEALSEINRAQAIDPHSASILADKGVLLWDAGHHEEGVRLLRQLEETDPNSASPHRYLRFVYFESGDDAGYLAEIKKEALLMQNPALSAIAQAAEKGFASGGVKGMLEAQLEQQKKSYRMGKLSPYFIAETYSRMGNTDEAMKYLEACYDRRSDEVLNITVNHVFDKLHGVPAYQQLLARAGLPPVN
jgi:tetratricopeptide (TPR) repeat protein